MPQRCGSCRKGLFCDIRAARLRWGARGSSRGTAIGRCAWAGDCNDASPSQIFRTAHTRKPPFLSLPPVLPIPICVLPPSASSSDAELRSLVDNMFHRALLTRPLSTVKGCLCRLGIRHLSSARLIGEAQYVLTSSRQGLKKSNYAHIHAAGSGLADPAYITSFSA